MATISLNEIAGDGKLSQSEVNSDLIVSGGSQGLDEGTVIEVKLNGEYYLTNTLADGSWSVTIPSSRLQELTNYTKYTVLITGGSAPDRTIILEVLLGGDYQSLTPVSLSNVDEVSGRTDADMTIQYGSITQQDVDNYGCIYDMLMSKVERSLETQCKCNRITGEKYADAYIQAQGLVIQGSLNEFDNITSKKLEILSGQENDKIARYKSMQERNNVYLSEIQYKSALSEEVGVRENNRLGACNLAIKGNELILSSCLITEKEANTELLNEQAKGFYRDAAYKIFKGDSEMISMLATAGVINEDNSGNATKPYAKIIGQMNVMSEVMLNNDPKNVSKSSPDTPSDVVNI